jgi:hypothetical protein
MILAAENRIRDRVKKTFSTQKFTHVEMAKQAFEWRSGEQSTVPP